MYLLGIIGPQELIAIIIVPLFFMVIGFFIGWFAAKAKFRK